MPYTRTTYSTSVSAAQLNNGEAGIEDVDARATALESGQPINVAQQAGATNAEKLTAAIALLPATGAWLHIPRGKYDGSWTITGKDHLTVTGEGSGTVIHNTTASPADALRFVDCDALTVKNLRVQGTAGTRDGLHLENCLNGPRVQEIYCQGSGRHGIYAQRCFGLVVDQCVVGIDSQSPYPTGVTNCLTGLRLSYDGSDVTSGCNQFVVIGGQYIVGQSQEWAIHIDYTEGGNLIGPIAELSSGGILLDTCYNVRVDGYYTEFVPSAIEYVTGTATTTNGSTAVTGSGTSWNSNDGRTGIEGIINAYPGKWVVIGGHAARIASVESNTALTLETNWTGSTASGQTYSITSVGLCLKNSRDCRVSGGLGGEAVLLIDSDRNLLDGTLMEQLFINGGSDQNVAAVTTNRVSTSTGRIKDFGVGSRITQVSYQNNARVTGGVSLLNDPNLQAHQGLRTFTAGTYTDPAPGVTLCMKVNTGLATDYLYGLEQSDPAAPPADIGVLYFRDNGAGKTQLCVRFATGAVVVIATEP